MIWCHSCQRETALLDGECETCRSDFIEQIDSEAELDASQPILPEFITNILMTRTIHEDTENANILRGNRTNNQIDALEFIMNTLQQNQQRRNENERTQIHTDMYYLFNNLPTAPIPEPSTRQTRSQTRNQQRELSQQESIPPLGSERSRPSTEQERERRAVERNELLNSILGTFVNAMTANGPLNTAANFNAAGDYVFGGQEQFDQVITNLMGMNDNPNKPPPASEETLRNLPKSVFQISMEEKECSICQEDFEIGKDFVKLPCMHGYHNECISGWLKVNGTCPVCRYSLVDNPIRDVVQGSYDDVD